MQVKRKMSGGKSAHSFYSAPGIYHLLEVLLQTFNQLFFEIFVIHVYLRFSEIEKAPDSGHVILS